MLTGRLRPWRGPLLVGVGVAILVGAFLWVPAGKARGGRVMVVERHSTWEPTTEPYGTEVYGEAGSYNYAAAYDYCGQYFDDVAAAGVRADRRARRCGAVTCS